MITHGPRGNVYMKLKTNYCHMLDNYCLESPGKVPLTTPVKSGPANRTFYEPFLKSFANNTRRMLLFLI